ncbi:MAG: PAS domain S-box protein, partial [Actinomycetes bacterium]
MTDSLGQEVFRVALESSAIGMMLVATDGTFLLVNSALCAMLGRDEQTLMTATWQELTHPDDLVVDLALVDDVLTGKRETYRLVKRFLRPDGVLVWGDLSVACRRDSDGAVRYFISQLVDVTEQISSREQLRESEQRFRMLAENSSDVVYQANLAGVVEWMSPSVKDLLGWDPAASIGTVAVDLVEPDDQPIVDFVRQGVYGGSAVSGVELRVRAADGTSRFVSATAKPLRDLSGSVIGGVVGLRDIDEQVRARREAQEVAKRLRATADGMLDPQALLAAVRDDLGRTVDFEFLEVNRAMCDSVLASREDLVGSRLLALDSGLLASGMFERLAAVVETGEPLVLDTSPYPSVPGDMLRFFDVRATWSAAGLVLTWRDVTERVTAAAAIQESETRYRLVVQNTMDMVFSLDTKAIIEWVSPSATRLLGYTPADLVGQFGGILISPDDLPILLDAATDAREGRPASCRIRMLTAGGEDRWVEAVPRVIHDDAGVLVGGVIGVRDIHDEVLAQQALEREVEFDSLTGLAKRPLALARIREILDTRADRGWALLCVGVNGLTSVNQAFTYAAGDQVLQAVAHRLQTATGTGDRVARIAGDEFAVLMPETDHKGAAVVMPRIRSLLEAAMLKNGWPATFS